MEKNSSNTVSNNPTSTPRQVPTVPSQPSSSKALLFSLVALEVITLLVAGYFGYQFLQLKKTITENQTISTPIPVAIVQPTSYPDQTSDWKTFANKDYNIEFKYPNSWTEAGKQDFYNNTIINLVTLNTPILATGVYIDGGPDHGGYDPAMTLVVNSFKNISNIDDWVKAQKDSGTVYAKVSEVKNFGQNEFSIVTGLGTVGGCTKNFFIKMPQGGYLSLAIEPYNNDCTDKASNNLIDDVVYQVLTTFKFTQ